LLAAIIVFLVVPEQTSGAPSETFQEQLSGLKTVLRSKAFWAIAPWAFTAQSAYLSIQGLWSGPWLRDVAGYNREQLADMLWWIAIAMILGYFAFGSLAGRLAKYGVKPATVAASGMGVFILTQFSLAVAPFSPALLWIGFGFFGTACILPYAVLAQIFPKHLTGRSNTSLNLLVFVCAFSAQWLIGAIIELWPIAADGRYHPQGYTTAFLVLICGQLLAAGWFLLNRKKVC
jgi:predicted MFS family arabinose efflux permease